jgi:spore maturation protein CgeB
MRVVVFCHSVVSDWNHGNAHFLRGVTTELLERGHEVAIYEPQDGWSRTNLVAEHGLEPLHEFRRTFPRLQSRAYDLATLDLDAATAGADVVLVHEWNDPELVRRLGALRKRDRSFRLLFHDTHHRSVTAPKSMARYDLRHYDGVLAYGEVIRRIYLRRGWAERVWTWHEAADVRVFKPRLGQERSGDLVWIGNWGDGERTRELRELLLRPARGLSLSGSVFGVRYPKTGRAAIARTGLAYRGWVANHRVPLIFAQHAVTVHVPRRPYVKALPGIPTIRPFEALACGIPLVSAWWDDAEGLFTPGEDYLVAHDGGEMTRLLGEVLRDRDLRTHLVQHGRRTILARHTCAHRVDELLAILAELGVDTGEEAAAAAAAGEATLA